MVSTNSTGVVVESRWRQASRAFLRRGSCVGAGAVCLLVFVGCGWVPGDSKQGKELAKILHEKRHIAIVAPDDLSVHFDAPEIERKMDGTQIWYRGVVAWRQYGGRDRDAALQERLRRLAAERYGGRAVGTVSQVAFLLEYQDEKGKACGSDTVWVDLHSESGQAILPGLGKGGTPSRANATLCALRAVESRKIRVTSAVERFFQLGVVEVGLHTELALKGPQCRQEVVRAGVPWRLAGTPAEVRAGLLGRLLARRPDLRDRKVKAVSLSFEYLDGQGRSLGTETVAVVLDAPAGTLLPQQVEFARDAAAVRVSLGDVIVQDVELRVPVK